MKISSSPNAERPIADKVSCGRCHSADEVREGLELLEEREKESGRSQSNRTADIATAFDNIAKDVPDADWESVPADFSKQLDHYLYGCQKTS
jgi:Arc/MetJ-type ribon-helix-helix transcriptional regulator